MIQNLNDFLKLKQKIRFTEEQLNTIEFLKFDCINENNEISDEIRHVLDLIRNNEYEEHNAHSFLQALNKSKHKEMLSEYSISELNEMKLFKLKGYNIGFALKLHDGKFSEIVSVFNNEDSIKNIGRALIESAIENGGCYLDHYDGYLSDFYQSLGFEEYDRYEFDPQYDKGGKFEKKYGRKDVILRKHKNCK